METVNDRLKMVIDETFGGNVSAFSRALNISQSTLKDIVGGKMNKPSYGVLEKIVGAKTLNISMEWLLTGEGDRNRNNTLPSLSGIRYHSYIDATAGNAMVFDDERESVYSIINVPGFEDCTDAVNVWGDSMYPVLNSGEIILLKEWKESFINFGKIYLIVTKNGNRMVKYLKPSDKEGMVRCVSENPEHPPFDIPINSVHKFYIVKGHIEKCEI